MGADLGRRSFLSGGAAALALASLGGCATMARSRRLRLTLAGQALMKHPLCADPYPGFDQVVAELARGEVAFTNLEVAIRTPRSGAPTREGGFMHAAEPAVLDCVKRMGFDLLSLANNHAWDLGTQGVLATREAVAARGFAHAGTGPDLASASAAGFVAGAPRVGLVAMAVGKIREGGAATDTRAGVNELRFAGGALDEADVARNLNSIAAAAASGDCVVAYLHNHEWGEDMAVTKPWARDFARRCVEAGAQVFVSHGAPLLHGIELYRGRPLLHDLGSLVFHTRTEVGYYPAEVWETVIVHCEFEDGRLAALEAVPVVLNETGDDPARHLETRGRPRIATGAAAERILGRLAKMSGELGAALRVERDRATLTLG